jgi:putative FmdB family regulatory protein
LPIYDYICTACAHRMEVVHGILGHGPDACPVCGAGMRKALVMPAIHFKGSGWAKKDRGTASSTRAAAKAAASRDEASSTAPSSGASPKEARAVGGDRAAPGGEAASAGDAEARPAAASKPAVTTGGAD